MSKNTKVTEILKQDAIEETWGQETKAQWTHRLIPDLAKCYKCRHRKVDFYFTQFATGDGVFNSYTNKIKKTDNDICLFCPEAASPKNAFFNCPKFKQEREDAEKKVGQKINVENMIQIIMLENEENILYEEIQKLIKSKEAEERRLEKQESGGMKAIESRNQEAVILDDMPQSGCPENTYSCYRRGFREVKIPHSSVHEI